MFYSSEMLYISFSRIFRRCDAGLMNLKDFDRA